MKYLFSLLVALILCSQICFAQSGTFIGPSTSIIPSPVNGRSWLFNSSNYTIVVWNGSGWQMVSAPFSNFTATVNPTTSNDSTQGYVVGSMWYNQTSSTLFLCANNAASAAVWTTINVAPTSGTVTNFSANTLSPLFTTSVASSSTTPVLSFALSNAAAHAIFCNTSGSTGAPSYNALSITAGNNMTGGGFLTASPTIGISAPVTVPNGGTGLTAVTAHYLIIGNGTSAVTLLAPSSTVGVPVVSAGTSADPAYGQLDVSSSSAVKNQLAVANGGTGLASITAHNVLVGAGTSNINPVALANGQPLLGVTSADPAGGTLGQVYGGTGKDTSGATDGQVLIGKTSDHSLNLATLTAGSNVTITNSAGGVTIASSAGVSFGGNGADGAISNPSAYTAPIQKNATTFSLTGANTLTLTGTPTIINCSGTFTLGDGSNASTITNTAGGGAAGGMGGVAANYGSGGQGGGSGGGNFGVGVLVANAGGGGGGGFGGTGGTGGSGNANTTVTAQGGATYQSSMNGGSGGGGGTGINSGNAGKNGGNGGGAIIVCAIGAVNCQAASVINALGAAGVSGTSANCGGGGSGGLVFLASQASVTVAGTINVTGGAGGTATTAGGGGGGGGSGRIIVWSPSNSTGSGTFTMNGGAGGTHAGTGTDGGSGSNGSLQSITGSPNLPLFAWVNTTEGSNALNLLSLLSHGQVNQKSLAWMAGGNTLQGMCYYNMGNFEESVCLGIGDSVKVMDNAA